MRTIRRSSVTFILAALFTLVPQAADADSESIDAVMARLTNANLATEYAKLTPPQQYGVRQRITLATIETFVTEKTPKKGLASPLAQGCWTRNMGVRGRTVIGLTLWEHYAVMNWCEDGSVVTSGNGYGYGTVYQIGWFYRGTSGWTTEGGPGFSYYGDFRQSTFEACLTWCWSAAYPWTNHHTMLQGGRLYSWTDWRG